MTITLSIVSFNTRELLRKCLDNIFASKSKNDLRVVVLDNNSLDGSAEMVEKDFKKVELIKSKDNLGFALGQNEILGKSQSDLAILINPDCEFKTEDIDKMADFMEENPDCGISSCKILYPDGSLQSNGGDLPTGLSLLSWLFNLEFLGNLPNFHRGEKDYYEKKHQVGWVAGTFMVVRKNVFEKVGLLNDDYFMYFEDVDFCYKANKSGFKIMINPDVEIVHIGGASSKDPHFNQWKGEMLGLIKFYKLNFSFLTRIILKVLVYLAVFLRIIAFAVLGKGSTVRTYQKIIYQI